MNFKNWHLSISVTNLWRTMGRSNSAAFNLRNIKRSILEEYEFGLNCLLLMSVQKDHVLFFTWPCIWAMYSQTFSVEIQYVCLLKPGILACQNRWCNSAIQRIITVRIKLVDGAGNWLVSLVNCDEKSIFFIQQTGLAAHWWHDKTVKHCFIYLHQNYTKHPGTYTLILSRKTTALSY